MSDRDLHAPLIGVSGSRGALNTPVLVLDRDTLDANIAAMAAFARGAGVALRPHAKTHKSADIAKLQIAAGAAGVCCAKLGEAEALAERGVDDILITSPVVTSQAITRLIALHARIANLAIVADHPKNVAALAAAANSNRPLRVLVDIDPGIRRTGVSSPAAALDLARQIADAPSLRFSGVQFYCGMQQHIEGYADRRAALEERTAYLQSIVALLRDNGLAPPVVTGGGTGTHRIDAALGVLTELQVGSYVFMDRQYLDCALAEEGPSPFAPSLFVEAHIISANAQGMATIDAGFKALAADGGPPRIAAGAPDGAKFVFMGDEHGAVIAPDGVFALGATVRLVTPHCDPTVNLYDAYHVVRGETLIDIWPVDARGRSR
ncbi:MAG: DSD1 family PLP-dependent enzyme [Alphaproteobacteria bacterium]|nr:DSD1 family PLP-dependent enzyme [Alphaproteobacteria bacterium]